MLEKAHVERPDDRLQSLRPETGATDEPGTERRVDAGDKGRAEITAGLWIRQMERLERARAKRARRAQRALASADMGP